jgi:osmotically-inducible protein OsmY
MVQSRAQLNQPAAGYPTEPVGDVKVVSPYLGQVLEDLRLAKCVVRRLRASRHGSLRAIGVTVCAGKVLLEGQVPSYYAKQLAQAAAAAVSGIQDACNNLKVGPST